MAVEKLILGNNEYLKEEYDVIREKNVNLLKTLTSFVNLIELDFDFKYFFLNKKKITCKIIFHKKIKKSQRNWLWIKKLFFRRKLIIIFCEFWKSYNYLEESSKN